jgi:uncharacterized repeat protein (TIGR01451 family)
MLAGPSAVSMAAEQPDLYAMTADGFTVTVSNVSPRPVGISSFVDTLPAGITYVGGSTGGGVTTEPQVSGSTLTWSGPFVVPAKAAGETEGMFQFQFGVQVSSASGTYVNTITANTAATLSPATATAEIFQGVIVPTPLFCEGLAHRRGAGWGQPGAVVVAPATPSAANVTPWGLNLRPELLLSA